MDNRDKKEAIADKILQVLVEENATIAEAKETLLFVQDKLSEIKVSIPIRVTESLENDKTTFQGLS
jgi:hypothetical protein